MKRAVTAVQSQQQMTVDSTETEQHNTRTTVMIDEGGKLINSLYDCCIE